MRSLAKDLERLRVSARLLQPDVAYSDGFRSFRGADKYRRPFWVNEGVADAKVVSLVVVVVRC